MKNPNFIIPIQENNEFYENSGENGMYVLLVAHKTDESSVSFAPLIRVYSDEVFVGSDKPFLQSRNVKHNNSTFNEILTLEASFHLGKTWWTGFDKSAGAYWKCTYDDLTDEAKELYNLTQRMYPECNLYILTFLDT